MINLPALASVTCTGSPVSQTTWPTNGPKERAEGVLAMVVVVAAAGPATTASAVKCLLLYTPWEQSRAICQLHSKAQKETSSVNVVVVVVVVGPSNQPTG